MRTRNKTLLIIWLVSLAVVVVISRIPGVFRVWGPLDRFFAFTHGSASLVLIITSVLLLIAVAGWIFRMMFWRVGTRLALSYALIGILPFFLFGVLLVVIGYIGVGVLSQASFRAERRTDLARLEQANVEYALTGAVPSEIPGTVEFYDSRNRTSRELPEWLRQGSFLGLLRRGDTAVLVSAKNYRIEGRDRTVALVIPFDDEYREGFERRTGIRIWHTKGKKEEGPDFQFSAAGGEEILGSFLADVVRFRGVFWGDTTPPLIDWETGEETSEVLLVAISNAYSNLVNFYLGSSDYLNVLLGILAVLSTILLLVYLVASLMAAGLIVSISRAINRIEKGTSAVERGDFSYRINLNRRNQLGDVAESFDRMTASISSLLGSVAEKERLQSEIAIAADIQRNLLPRAGPALPGVLFSAHFEPTTSIGGDYYDVFPLGPRRFAVAIGDVSGHGLSTGLVMAMVKAAITTLVEEGADESTLFRRLNDLVYRSTERRAFMTLAFTVFDLELRTIRHTNSGHLYPYVLRRHAAPSAIEVPSLPLGVRPVHQTRTTELDLEPGDCIVYLSDGIIEALDVHGDPFGFDRLEEILAFMIEDDPQRIRESILMAVADHSGGRAPEDDKTIMIVKFEDLMEAPRADLQHAEEVEAGVAP
jgi:serine phosphatase RsbU (regulator of sigma subunit)